ncbi:MAG: F0F1 ATP synthase subunit B [Hyphomonadaceae bacterium]|jgi:F-type H+-transporting ATPase subunit b|nr:F0F1 ATP synthase subunit B [Hyphomonadaceae bacterium]
MAAKVNTGTTGHSDVNNAKVFSPLDTGTFVPQLVWLALTFGLLYVLLKRFALPRVGEVIEERRERIQRDLDKAEKLKVETEQALAHYEQALAEARAKANAIANDVRAKLAAEVDKERAAVEAEIARKLADAEARIAQSKSKAMASVADIAADTAGAVVSRLLGKEVTKDEVQRALVQRAAE